MKWKRDIHDPDMTLKASPNQPYKMASQALVTMVILVLLPSSGALTAAEVALFTARTHTEKNTNTQGTVSFTNDGTYYTIVSNGIPDHNTGTFPATSNPNSIILQSHSKRFPMNPSFASVKKCLPKGEIGFALNGVPIFNPYNAFGENAVEGDTAEVFDLCNGHPNDRGTYHYHQTPNCLYNDGNDELVGVALDGFPIYGIKVSFKDSNGKELKSSDLDTCHGREENGQYRYRMTRDFPYIMGCFKGTPSPDIPDRMFEDKDCKIVDSSGGARMLVSVCVVILSLAISQTEVF